VQNMTVVLYPTAPSGGKVKIRALCISALAVLS
jgi:hypothetical protein